VHVFIAEAFYQTSGFVTVQSLFSVEVQQASKQSAVCYRG